MDIAAKKLKKEEEDKRIQLENEKLSNQVMDLKKKMTLKDHEINEKSAQS